MQVGTAYLERHNQVAGHGVQEHLWRVWARSPKVKLGGTSKSAANEFVFYFLFLYVYYLNFPFNVTLYFYSRKY